MDRREFLKATSSVAAGVMLPATAENTAVSRTTYAELFKAIGDAWAPADHYVAILHPRQAKDLEDLDARWRWEYAHRAARRAGKKWLSPQEMLKQFPDRSERFEMGKWEGFRIIETKRLS